jgi:hypothetical protein
MSLPGFQQVGHNRKETFPAHGAFAKSLAFSPKGDTLFSGGGYGEQRE